MAPIPKKLLQTRLWLSLGIGLTVCAALASVPAGAAAKKPATPPSLYWGAQIGPQITGESAPWDMNAVTQFQGVTGKGLSLIQFAQPFAECSPTCVFTHFPTTPLENIRSYGAIPVLSLNSTSSPPSVDQPAFRLARIIDGSFDSYLQYFATKAKEFGHPFFIRFNWEMNGFWFPWSEGVNGNKPGEFVAAWRHVHDIFAAAGATNVSWVWCPNVNIYGELAKLGPLYPGNRYVDWTCLDGFNWGVRHGSPGWLSFNKIYHSTYRQILRLAPHKPVMIAEIASSEKGGSKAAWIKEMLSKLRNRYRKVRAVIWHDLEDRGAGWPIETSSRRAQNAFRKGIRNRAYRPNIFGGTGQSPIRPPAPG
jgi:Glycosyl hydrolase family 26